jgi:magnesium transporter
MIRGYRFCNGMMVEIGEEDLWDSATLEARNAVQWVIVQKPAPDDIHRISRTFNLHPTTSEDIAMPDTRIKYEEFEENTFLIIKGVKRITPIEVDFYTLFIVDGDRYIITVYHPDVNDTIEQLERQRRRLELLMAKGEDHILHYILDKEVDKYLDLREDISDEVKLLEEDFLSTPTKMDLQLLHSTELALLEIKRRADSMTDICLRLTTPTDNFIQNDLLPSVRDVHDHAFKAAEAFKTFLDRISGTKQAYASISSHRINETMRVLTILMALMMPLTIITGFFGMNIALPFEADANASLYIMIMMVVSLIALLYFFYRKGWMGKE